MTERATPRPTIAVGVTGASGAIYAVRTIAALLEAGCHLEIVFSDYGRRLLADELGPDAKVDRLIDWLAERYGDGVRRGSSARTSDCSQARSTATPMTPAK